MYVDGDITQAQVDRLNEMLKDYMSNEARSDWLQPADPLIYLNGTNVGRADIAYSATAVSSRVCVAVCHSRRTGNYGCLCGPQHGFRGHNVVWCLTCSSGLSLPPRRHSVNWVSNTTGRLTVWK